VSLKILLSFKVTQGHSNLHRRLGVRKSHCISPYLVSFRRQSEILVKNPGLRVVLFISLILNSPEEKTVATIQSCPWVGSTRGLGWVGMGRDFAVFDGLGRI